MQDDPNNLDQLIDDVAREMTGARPADDNEGFARRVSARIQDEEAAAAADAARTPPIWRRTRLLAPAAACVLVLGAILARHALDVRLKPDATPDTASGLRAQGSGLSAVQPSALSPQRSLGPQTLVRPRLDAAGKSATANVRLKPDATGETDSDLQPLTIAPIEMAALDVSPLVVAMPIEISTIAIERIEIAAMP